MTESINRQWRLARRPSGRLTAGDFTWSSEPIPTPGAGEVLIRVLYLSVDPTQRSWLAIDTYLPAVKIGEVVRSLAVGRIEASNSPDYQVGELVSGLFGWQDYLAIKAEKGTINRLPPGATVPLALGALGMTGLTAYFGLLDIGRPHQGDTVLISGAAGATGSIAGQIAKLKGCRTIGIAGGAEKCAWLLKSGFDAAIDYKNEAVPKRLKELCPKGIDVYFDNVGGDILDAALGRLALRGRVVLCGGISNYNATIPVGPRNYLNLVVQRGRMEGFLVTDFASRFGEAIGELSRWLAEGKVINEVDIQEGLENAPETLNRLFDGKNLGKQILKIA